MALTLRQLRYFVSIVEAGSLAAASARLNVAHTALSLQVRGMEDFLGVTLLERHSRGVRATPEGEELEQRARQILALVEDAERCMRRTGRPPECRVLRVGTPPAVARVLGAEVILAVAGQFPQIALHLIEGWSGDLQARLLQGDLDMMIGYFVTPIPELSHLALFDESFVFAAAPELAAGRRPISVAEALSHELVFYGARSISWQVAHGAAQRLGLSVRVLRECESIEVWRSFLVRGLGSAITPFGAIAEEFHKGALVVREIVGGEGPGAAAGRAAPSRGAPGSAAPGMPLQGRLSLAVRAEPGALPPGFVEFLADHVAGRYMRLGPYYRPFPDGQPLLNRITEPSG